MDFGGEMSSAGEECYIYRGWRRNQTDLIVSGYEGVPQNLILNLVMWALMILGFSIIRKSAFNYGRMALVERYETKWTEVFYGSTSFDFEDDGSLDPNPNISTTTTTSPTTSERPSVNQNQNGQQPMRRRPPLERRTTSIDVDSQDKGMFQWIWISLTLTDKQFERKSGPDAVQYLQYQRHLIFLGSVMTLFSLLIITPIHLQGTAVRGSESMPDLSDFRQATIQNLHSDSKLLWVHIILSIIFVLISILSMRHFSKGLRFVNRRGTCTLLISGVSRSSTHSDVLGHFSEVYPASEITEVNFAYDISRLQEIETNMEASQRSLAYCARYFRDTHQRLLMAPHCCGTVCLCQNSCAKSTDAIKFYARDVDKYKQKAVLERSHVLSKHLPVLFVTMKTVSMAEAVIVDHRLSAKCFFQTPQSAFSDVLKSRQWVVSFSPVPEDIIWENLSQGTKTWYFKLLVVNSILLVLTLFYSTPVMLLNFLNIYLTVKRENETDDKAGVSGVIRDTIPTVLLWITAVLIPSLVSVSDRMIRFWTKTAENRSKMIKTFTFLLFMVIILPSLGQTSFVALLGKPVRWECIFSSANVAFFVHYLTTSCFIGTASELMRFPELFLYVVRLSFTRSKADVAAVRKASLWEFQLGAQYAWMMLNFAIFTLFSLVCPVITPFGLMYLVMKHCVDRYNIFFAYGPCKVDKQVHGTAINFVIVCMFMLQVILLAYVNSNSYEVNKPLQAFAVIGLSITAALFVGQVFFNMCATFSPILYREDDVENPSSTQPTTDANKNQAAATSASTKLLPPVDEGKDEVDADIEPPFGPSPIRLPMPEICIQSGRYFAPILASASTTC